MNAPQDDENGLALETHDLTVAYDRKPVLYGIDVKIKPGQLVGIMGPNGAGKSTLIKAIMGLLEPASGWIQVFGQTNKSQRKRVAYVPQRREVDWDFPVTVMDVVLMGRYGHLGLFKRPGKADRDIAMDSLEKVQMIPFADRQISNLSGGQQQRVFLARALAQQSDLYLMDEPFVGVDASTESTIIQLLQDLRSEERRSSSCTMTCQRLGSTSTPYSCSTCGLLPTGRWKKSFAKTCFSALTADDSPFSARSQTLWAPSTRWINPNETPLTDTASANAGSVRRLPRSLRSWK